MWYFCFAAIHLIYMDRGMVLSGIPVRPGLWLHRAYSQTSTLHGGANLFHPSDTSTRKGEGGGAKAGAGVLVGLQ